MLKSKTLWFHQLFKKLYGCYDRCFDLYKIVQGRWVFQVQFSMQRRNSLDQSFLPTVFYKHRSSRGHARATLGQRRSRQWALLWGSAPASSRARCYCYSVVRLKPRGLDDCWKITQRKSVDIASLSWIQFDFGMLKREMKKCLMDRNSIKYQLHLEGSKEMISFFSHH